MTATLTTLLPIFLLIALGWALDRFGFPGKDLWVPVEKIVFYVLFPVLLFRVFDGANLRALPLESMAIVVAGSAVAVAVAGLGVGMMLRGGGDGLGTLVEGGIRFNAYIGIAVIAALYGGGRALTLAALYLVLMVAIGNIVAAAAQRDSGSLLSNIGGGFVDTVRNPLILGCAAGMAVSFLRLKIPGWLDAPLGMMAGAAIPLGLLCFGAALELTGITRSITLHAAGAALKLAGLPLVAFALCELVKVGGPTATVLIVMSALPAAWASYAQDSDRGDNPLAGMLTVQTIAAIFTLPLVITRLA